MVTNALFATTILFLALGLFLMGECRYLIAYRALLIDQYAPWIGMYAACLFVNVFAVIYSVTRWLFLKDTGRKLAHLEKQLRSGPSILAELSRRLEDE